MAVTGVVLAMVTNGVFGAPAIDVVNDVWVIERVNKPAYLGSGFLALTNWHQDPGYSALWTNVWIALSIVGVGRGVVRAPRWASPLVLGGLAVASLLSSVPVRARDNEKVRAQDITVKGPTPSPRRLARAAQSKPNTLTGLSGCCRCPMGSDEDYDAAPARALEMRRSGRASP